MSPIVRLGLLTQHIQLPQRVNDTTIYPISLTRWRRQEKICPDSNGSTASKALRFKLSRLHGCSAWWTHSLDQV